MLFKVKNSAFKANIAAIASKAISIIGPLITVPLFIKYLTIEEYGIWLMVLSATSFFYLSNAGIFKKKKDSGQNTGHAIDFMIPPPKWGTKREDYNGFLIHLTPNQILHYIHHTSFFHRH